MFSVRLAAAIALVAGCGDDGSKPPADTTETIGPSGRTYLLAARAERYDASALRPWTASLDALTQPAAEEGAPPVRPLDAIVVPLDAIGIPWNAFTGPDNRPTELPAAWLAEVERIEGLVTQAGLPVVLALSPLSPEYDTLAPDARDEAGALVLNSTFRPYCYDPSADGNPTRYRDQFAGYARWAAERFRPRMVIVAQRLNLYEATCGESAYTALVDYAAEAHRRIAASEVLSPSPTVIASLDVEDLYGFPKKDGRCQTGTPADCLAQRAPLIATLADSGVPVIGLESYPHRALSDASAIPSDWLARVTARVSGPLVIAGASLPAVSLETERGVCTPLLSSSETAQRAFLDQVLATAQTHDMTLVAWRHLLDLQPSAVITACPCGGDFALCSHLDGLGSKRDERRLMLVGGLASDAADRQAMDVWKALLTP